VVGVVVLAKRGMLDALDKSEWRLQLGLEDIDIG
jgi:hypothetical protein